MRRKILFSVLFPAICNCNTGISKPIHPGIKVEFLHADYGILSETDKTRTVSLPLMWRCFPIKDVDVRYRTWPDTDPMEPKKVIEIMCDFEIWVNSKPFQNVYHGRRGKPESYCKDFKAAWTKLTQGEEYICMDGETLTKGEPEVDANTKKMRTSWTWDKIKTKKGSYCFWDGWQCADY